MKIKIKLLLTIILLITLAMTFSHEKVITEDPAGDPALN